MKKAFLIILSFATLFIFDTGCGRAKNGEYGNICNYDTYKCSDNSSYYCGYSGDELLWILSETCRNGCNSSTGKCKSANSGSGSGSNNNTETKRTNCQGLPENAEWNTVSTITQTWNGSSWTPSNQGTYNTSASIEECHFKCKKNYTWSGTKCKADSRVSDCTGLPANAEWNTVPSITQTWNGSSWQPAASGEYSETPSSTECRFQCVEDYFWNGSACIDPCESDPCRNIDNGTGVCVGIDSVEYKCECAEGFIWNGAECVDPCSPNPCRDKENSTHNCNVDESSAELYSCECADTFAWNESSKECLNPCEPNPCDAVENSTGVCNKVDNFTKYSCECNDTFTWNENSKECLNPCDPNPCVGVENSTETCIKVDNFTKYSCECENAFIWNEHTCVECTGISFDPTFGYYTKDDEDTGTTYRYVNLIGTIDLTGIPEDYKGLLTLGFYSHSQSESSWTNYAAVGTYNLGKGNNANNSSCNQCVMLSLYDAKDDYAYVGSFFQKEGTLKVTRTDFVVNDHYYYEGILSVKLAEVEILDSAPYTSTFVEGGDCYEIESGVWSVFPAD